MVLWTARADRLSDEAHEETRPGHEADPTEPARLLLGKKELVPGIEALFFAADPIGISFEHNTDAYRPEAQLIAARIGEAATIDELHRIVYEEFVRWFGDAGPHDRYQAIARDIWRLAHGNNDD